MTIQYILDYQTKTEGSNKIVTICWEVPEFDEQLLKNEAAKEIYTEKSEDTVDSLHIRLKMEFSGRNVVLYCLTSTDVILKVKCLKRQYCGGDEDEYTPIKDTRMTKKYHTVEANKWHYFVTFSISNAMCCSDDEQSCFSLVTKFIFKIISELDTQLSFDFENMLNIGKFTDVTIRSADGKEFKAHKAVLASRSAVLAAHFEHNTTECSTNVIESPFDSEVLHEVLIFIYSNKAPKVDEIPEKLLVAADFYQLSLKNICEEVLPKKLTVDNAIEILQLADLHSAYTVKRSTLDFIKNGHANLITKTEAWDEIQSVPLIKSIYEFITKK